MPLAPARWLLKAIEPELSAREYRKQLESRDAKQVAQEMAPKVGVLRYEARHKIIVPSSAHRRWLLRLPKL